MEAEGAEMSLDYTRKSFITDIFNGCFAVMVFIALTSVTISFFKALCLEIDISTLWAYIPTIASAYVYKKFSIWLVT